VSQPESVQIPPDGSPEAAAWPRRPQRLATAVVADLVDRIVGAEFTEGTALPIEPVLCERYAVSRTVIREAVKALEAMRLVRVLQGHGTTVRRFEDWDLLTPVVLAATVRHDAELSILEDLIDVRCTLESQMARQAAGRATDASCENADPARYLKADLDFHDAIMAASGNRLGRAIIHNINAEAFRSLRYIGEPTKEECELSNVAHQAVWERIEARDADGASQAMNDHILGSWQRRRPDRSSR